MNEEMPEVPVKAPDEPQHWLVRKSTIRLIWIVSVVVLAVLTLLDLAIKKKSYFEIEDGFGFGSWYGFLACVVLVVGSKLLGMVLKRPDTYYDD